MSPSWGAKTHDSRSVPRRCNLWRTLLTGTGRAKALLSSDKTGVKDGKATTWGDMPNVLQVHLGREVFSTGKQVRRSVADGFAGQSCVSLPHAAGTVRYGPVRIGNALHSGPQFILRPSARRHPTGWEDGRNKVGSKYHFWLVQGASPPSWTSYAGSAILSLHREDGSADLAIPRGWQLPAFNWTEETICGLNLRHFLSLETRRLFSSSILLISTWHPPFRRPIRFPAPNSCSRATKVFFENAESGYQAQKL